MLRFLTIAIVMRMPAAQTDPLPALYAIENITKNGVVETHDLVRLSLDQRNRLTKEKLLTTDSGFFGYSGGHHIAGRFVITQFGGVIDVQARKVIHDEQQGKLLGFEDGKIIYQIDNSRRLSGLFSFDLNTRKLDKLNSGQHWELPGVKSPDKTMSVNQAQSLGHTLRLYRLGKDPVDLDVGDKFNLTYSLLASVTYQNDAPCLWLDAKRILTARANRKLVTVTTDGALEEFADIRDAPLELLSPPSLWLDKQGRIIYTCGNKDFLVDVRSRATFPLERYALGHGFEASVAVDDMDLTTIYHDGKVIGKWVFNPFEAQTAAGLIALAYYEPTAHRILSNVDGIAIWCSRVGEWQTSKMWVNWLVGWAD